MDYYSPQRMRQTDLSYPLTRQGHPGPRAWEFHKARIIRFYAEERMKLADVVQLMQDEFGFRATPAMYKTRLRTWNVYRNKRRRQSCHEGNQRQHTSEHRSNKRARRRASNVVRASMVDSAISGMSFSNGGPPKERRIRPARDLCGAMFPMNDLYRPRTGDGRSSGTSDGISTEDSADIEIVNDTPDGSVDSAQEGEADTYVHVAPQNQQLTRVAIPASRRPADIPYTAHDMTQWLNHGANADCADAYAYYFPTAGIPRMPTKPADPQCFVGLCINYCSLWSDQRYKEADAEGDRAAQVFASLLHQPKGPHRHALTALNTVMAMAVLYDRSAEAIDLMNRAKVAAEKTLLTSTHPIVQTIEYLMFQAAGDFTTMQASQLEHGYAELCKTFGPRHPYSLLAGYLLAFRLSADYNNDISLLQSARLLCKLQIAADGYLGVSHLLSIAVLMTKARVQQTLQLFPDAAVTMGEAVRRINSKYLPDHPYVLNAKARYADILFAAFRDDEAEVEWVTSALGKVELFGKEHPKSQETIMDVRGFYAAIERDDSCQKFQTNVDVANERFLSRRSTRARVVTGKPDP